MSKMKINPTVRIIIAILHKLDRWNDNEESKCRKIGRKLFYLFSFTMLEIVVALFAFLSDDTDQSIFLTEISLAALVLHVKLMFVIWKMEKVLDFLYDSIDFNSNLECEGKFQANKMQFGVKFVQAYISMVVGGVVLVCVSALPIFPGVRKLPFFITFSLDCEYSAIIYWVAYIILAWGLVLGIYSNFITILIWYILLNYSIKYRMLGNQFQHLGVIRSAETATHVRKKMKTQNQNLFFRDFVGLVKSHRKLSGTIDQFTSFFHILFLAQMIVSGIFICTSTYVLAFTSTIENVFEIVIYTSCFIYGVSDIFVVMYLANEITLASDQLSYCLFESNWIEQSRSGKKYIIILSEFLQRPQELLILKLYPMNLVTFTRIMDVAYKMFNIFKSLSGNQ